MRNVAFLYDFNLEFCYLRTSALNMSHMMRDVVSRSISIYDMVLYRILLARKAVARFFVRG